jgi:predicted RNA binding protein YcfA (HicA-like mRNA interferase family)
LRQPVWLRITTQIGVSMTAREAIQRLRREGWAERPGKGSHMIFKKDGRRVVVSNHPGEIPTGTLRAICAQAGWEYPPQR